MPTELRMDQQSDLQWLQQKMEELGEAFLCLPVGYGKTILTLKTIESIRQKHGPLRTVVFSTKNIIDLTWGQEIAA